MKLTVWKASSSVASTKEDFEKKLSALRMATGRPERFVTRCACAMHDKGFTAIYERTEPARPFILVGIHKDGEGNEPQSAGAARSLTLPAAEVDHTGWRCPHCGNDMHIGCDQCQTNVCGGKTRRYPGTSDIFSCRTSCGARGTLVDAQTVKGIEPTRKSFNSKPIAERLPAPGTDMLRLGGSKPPRLK